MATRAANERVFGAAMSNPQAACGPVEGFVRPSKLSNYRVRTIQ